MFQAPSAMFSVVGLFYGLLLPVSILSIIALLFIPTMHGSGVKVMSAGKAIYCYLLQSVGILLMTLGGLPAIYGVLARQPYDSNTYLALLIVFACGGLTFLWHDHLSRTIDAPSRAIPHAIYLFTFKMMGYMLTLLSTLSLLLTMLLGMQNSATNWWVMPLIFLLYGVLLLWCTRSEPSAGGMFQSTPMMKTLPGFPRKMMAKKR